MSASPSRPSRPCRCPLCFPPIGGKRRSVLSRIAEFAGSPLHLLLTFLLVPVIVPLSVLWAGQLHGWLAWVVVTSPFEILIFSAFLCVYMIAKGKGGGARL